MKKRFDLDSRFGEGKKGLEGKTIRPGGTVFRIDATTVTPLLQTAEGGIRKRFVLEEGRRGAVPFYSANGLRGALRRVATRQQIAAAKAADPGFEVTPETFYLFTSGAGLGKLSVENVVTPENEAEIRERHPILSLFGAGLSGLPGKLAVADLFPASETEFFVETENGIFPAILGRNTFYRVDSIRDSNLWRPVMDVKAIERWRDDYFKEVLKEKAKVKKAKEEGERDKKEEASHIQQPVTLEFIIPGVRLTSSLSPINAGNDLNDVEAGMLVSALAELSTMQIGSAKRIGFGVLDWAVEVGGEPVFRTAPHSDYVLDRSCEMTPEGERLAGIWREWLGENATSMAEFGKA